jgi:hypothetical protein
MEESVSVEIITDPDPRGPKTYGSGSGTLPQTFVKYTALYKKILINRNKQKQIKKVQYIKRHS